MKLINLVLCALFLASCSTEFPATGSISHENRYTGTVTSDVSHKNYSIVLDSPSQTTHCYGSLTASSPTGFNFSCDRQQGVATFQCDDGNNLTGSFRATSCSSGFGQGIDKSGAPFSFSYGDNIRT